MTVTQALLRGEAVDHHGRFVQLTDVRLEQPPASPPGLLVGTTGERGIAVARDTGTGVLLPEGAGPEAIEWVAGRLGDGGRVATYAWLSIAADADADAARARMDPVFRDWSAWGLYPNLIARAAPEAIAGTPRDCADMVARLGAAGASSIALIPVGPDPGGQLERFAAEALPLLT
jgi:alkanesulfonate monooxygenase SsuD/methylene tetrahydromethanopterin reductase-like flavin-dependent oxidoreductase (luciferase family)